MTPIVSELRFVERPDGKTALTYGDNVFGTIELTGSTYTVSSLLFDSPVVVPHKAKAERLLTNEVLEYFWSECPKCDGYQDDKGHCYRCGS